jgi:DNA-binding NarL/FixJ family response regulator
LSPCAGMGSVGIFSKGRSMVLKQETAEGKTASAGRKIWRTLVVDDHQLFRDGLHELLESEPDIEICGEAESENEAYEKFRLTNPDLVTVDVSLAAGHGLNLVTRIKQFKPSTVVLVLSMFDDRVFAERALAAGASGYVCKQSANKEIIEALRAARNGEVYVRDDILQQILKNSVGKTPSIPGAGMEQLSDRELEVFALIGRGRTTHQIAKELHLAVSTIETYRERLKTKLNVASGTELTRQAILWLMQNS